MAEKYWLSRERLWTRLVDAFMHGTQFPVSVFDYDRQRVNAESQANRIIAALDAEQTDPIAQAAEQAAREDSIVAQFLYAVGPEHRPPRTLWSVNHFSGRISVWCSCSRTALREEFTHRSPELDWVEHARRVIECRLSAEETKRNA